LSYKTLKSLTIAGALKISSAAALQVWKRFSKS